MKSITTSELSFRTLLLILVVWLFLVPTIVVGTVWYRNSTAIITENSIDYTATVVGQLSSRFEDYFGELERSTYILTTQPVVGEFLAAEGSDAYAQYQMRRALEADVLTALTYSRGDVLNLALINSFGTVLSTYRDSSAREGYEWYLTRAHGFQSYASSFRIAGVREVNSVPVLTVVRLIRDKPYLEISGVLLIDLNYRRVSEILDRAKSGVAGSLMLVNADGTILYHTDRSRIGQMVSVDAKPSELVVRTQSDRTGLHVVSIIPRDELFAELGDLLIFTAVLGVVVIVLALFAVGTTAMSLSNGLRYLQRYMEEAERGNLRVQAPEPRTREMRSLYVSFNRMISEIGRLVEQVRRAEARENELKIAQLETAILAIQSQINPHFLYNTLEVVNSYALEHGVRPISSMVTHMARMFRYNIDGSNRTVRLRDEIDHIRSYLEIQREHYTDLEARINIEEAVQDQVCSVRLVLQPIVENSFLHGYGENTASKVRIEIAGIVEDADFLLLVADEGGGMAPEVRERHNALFGQDAAEEILSSYKDAEKASIGLLNVHTRLRLTYGSPYGVWIARSDGDGTVVRVTLPRKEVGCTT